jgi:hypothetical protein
MDRARLSWGYPGLEPLTNHSGTHLSSVSILQRFDFSEDRVFIRIVAMVWHSPFIFLGEYMVCVPTRLDDFMGMGTNGIRTGASPLHQQILRSSQRVIANYLDPALVELAFVRGRLLPILPVIHSPPRTCMSICADRRRYADFPSPIPPMIPSNRRPRIRKPISRHTHQVW